MSGLETLYASDIGREGGKDGTTIPNSDQPR